MVGKYVALARRLSVASPKRSATPATHHGVKVEIDWINSAELTDENVDERLEGPSTAF
ncbi:MAG: hypothetical protein MZU97_21845 [Bacillus subtilis]|nr:hypothetical protein [Bacillus subtilis]